MFFVGGMDVPGVARNRLAGRSSPAGLCDPRRRLQEELKLQLIWGDGGGPHIHWKLLQRAEEKGPLLCMLWSLTWKVACLFGRTGNCSRNVEGPPSCVHTGTTAVPQEASHIGTLDHDRWVLISKGCQRPPIVVAVRYENVFIQDRMCFLRGAQGSICSSSFSVLPFPTLWGRLGWHGMTGMSLSWRVRIWTWVSPDQAQCWLTSVTMYGVGSHRTNFGAVWKAPWGRNYSGLQPRAF